MPLQTDEHGEVILDPSMPEDVQRSDATVHRWETCRKIAVQFTGAEEDSLENAAFARVLYDSPLPTDDPELSEGVQDDFDELLHPRNRIGRWLDKPGKPKKPLAMPARLMGTDSTPHSPGTTEQEIAALGLDHWPSPGPAATALLGDAHDTTGLWLTHPPEPGAHRRRRHPSGRRVRSVYKAERRPLHDLIVGQALAGLPSERSATPTGIASLLGVDHPIVLKLSKGGRLTTKEKAEVRYAAEASRGGEAPDVLAMAGGTASGKTTILKANQELKPEHAVEIDPDEIKNMLPEYGDLRAAKDHYAATAVHQESGDVAARLRYEAMDLGLNMVTDGTGDSEEGDFIRELSSLRDKGYDVSLLYANVNTQEAIARTIDRAKQEGRLVPIPRVREVHAKVSRNFEQVSALPWLRGLDVFDESGHIATRLPDGTIAAIDDDRFAAFLAKKDEPWEETADE